MQTYTKGSPSNTYKHFLLAPRDHKENPYYINRKNRTYIHMYTLYLEVGGQRIDKNSFFFNFLYINSSANRPSLQSFQQNQFFIHKK